MEISHLHELLVGWMSLWEQEQSVHVPLASNTVQLQRRQLDGVKLSRGTWIQMIYVFSVNINDLRDNTCVRLLEHALFQEQSPVCNFNYPVLCCMDLARFFTS